MDDGFEKILCLAPGCDPTALAITPTEGFLLSRIDGQTPWRVLREIGAMPPEEVDLCLESWLARGILSVDEDKSEADRSRRRARQDREREQQQERLRQEREAREALPTEVDLSQVDESLDIGEEVQKRILEFEVGLAGTYYDILAVKKDADAKAIKKAYFRLSKEYHPDRYFRREIGDYAGRLDRIFKKITEAYELLSDPTARAEVEKSMNAAAATAPAAGVAPDAAAGGAPRELTPLERLRARMPFKIPESVFAERRASAEQFFQAAQGSQQRGRWQEAATSVRLAIAFDPFNEVYKRVFGDLRAQAASERAKELLESSDGLDLAGLRDALRKFEDVLLYRPHDPVMNDRAAAIALELCETDLALEYAQRAVEHSPDVGAYRRTLAKVQLGRAERSKAREELNKAVELDPSDLEAKKLLKGFKARTKARS